MSETDKGNDAETSAPALPAGTAAPETRPKPDGTTQAPSRLPAAALATGVLALLIGIGALTGGYFIWHEVGRQADWQKEVIAQIDHRNQAMEQRLAAMKDRIDRLLADAARRDREFQATLAKLAREQEALASAFSRLRAKLGRRLEGWILAEAQYLLEIANQRLRLFRDTATARAALREADRRIAEADDPGLLPVRERIARELAALDAVAAPDLAGLSARLAALAEQAERLPIAGLGPAPASDRGAAGEASPAERQAPAWRQALERIWRAFRELVSIRRTDRPVAPLLPPDQRFFLRTNLQLELEAARLALLRQQPALYRTSLERAKDWLTRFFDREDPGVQSAVHTLDALLAVDVAPELPDISGSLRLLRDRLRAIDERTDTPGEKAQ